MYGKRANARMIFCAWIGWFERILCMLEDTFSLDAAQMLPSTTLPRVSNEYANDKVEDELAYAASRCRNQVVSEAS